MKIRTKIEVEVLKMFDFDQQSKEVLYSRRHLTKEIDRYVIEVNGECFRCFKRWKKVVENWSYGKGVPNWSLKCCKSRLLYSAS